MKSPLISILLLLLLPLPAHSAGGENSAGGHGVELPDGTQVVLDRYRFELPKVCPEARPVDLLKSDIPQLREAAQDVLNRIESLNSKFPNMSARLKRLYVERLKWKLCPTALPLINDAAYSGQIHGRLFQGAIQSSDQIVLLDEARVRAGNFQFAQDLITHELLLGYLGLSVDREKLRSLTVAFAHAGGVNVDELQFILPTLHPGYLKGEFTIRLAVWVDGVRNTNIHNQFLGDHGFLFLVNGSAKAYLPAIHIPYGAESNPGPLMLRPYFYPMRPLFAKHGDPSGYQRIRFEVRVNDQLVREGHFAATKYDYNTLNNPLPIWLP